MKKQLVVGFVTLVVLGVVIAALVPLVLPSDHDHQTAQLLALRLSPIGLIGAIIAFFLAKPRNGAPHPGDGQR